MDMGGDETETPGDGLLVSSNVKDSLEILGKKEGDLGKGDFKGVMFMAALIQIGKPRNRSKTRSKK